MRSIIALLRLFVVTLAAQTDRATPAASPDQHAEETAAPLRELEVKPMPGAVKGRFDHFGVDLKKLATSWRNKSPTVIPYFT
jgi:hypothetical protein